MSFITIYFVVYFVTASLEPADKNIPYTKPQLIDEYEESDDFGDYGDQSYTDAQQPSEYSTKDYLEEVTSDRHHTEPCKYCTNEFHKFQFA